MSTLTRARLSRSPMWIALVASVLLGGLASHRSSADTAILASDGTLYEVFIAPYEDVVPGSSVVPGLTSQNFPIVALRTTTPGGKVALEVADGTVTAISKGLPSIALDEATGTLVVCYSEFEGLMSDLHVAVRRGGLWVSQDITPNPGIYLSLNPRMASTRQQYIDSDGHGGKVTKSRTIFSLVWWEESGPSQARYAPIFVEDGALSIDSVVAYNLNDLMGQSGVTNNRDLPLSAYQFPAVAVDPSSTTGGMLVSFANLVTQRELVVSITFPYDLTMLGSAPGALVRSHIPVGRQLRDGYIPVNRNTQADVQSFLSPTGLATSWWVDSTGLRYIRNDAPVTDPPKTLAIRSDFPVDRAVAVIRAMTVQN